MKYLIVLSILLSGCATKLYEPSEAPVNLTEYVVGVGLFETTKSCYFLTSFSSGRQVKEIKNRQLCEDAKNAIAVKGLVNQQNRPQVVEKPNGKADTGTNP